VRDWAMKHKSEILW